jgi:hypothetical protein
MLDCLDILDSELWGHGVGRMRNAAAVWWVVLVGLVLGGGPSLDLSARDCHALGEARIEWWSANAHGDYDAAHRATQPASADGQYHYTTDFPGRYPGRPPHLHVRVTAPGHRTLVTQVYPQKTQTALSVDFVLVPE